MRGLVSAKKDSIKEKKSLMEELAHLHGRELAEKCHKQGLHPRQVSVPHVPCADTWWQLQTQSKKLELLMCDYTHGLQQCKVGTGLSHCGRLEPSATAY